MDVTTGRLYDSKETALDAGVAEADVVELHGDPTAVQALARAVRRDLVIDRRRAAAKRARVARRKGRRS